MFISEFLKKVTLKTGTSNFVQIRNCEEWSTWNLCFFNFCYLVWEIQKNHVGRCGPSDFDAVNGIQSHFFSFITYVWKLRLDEVSASLYSLRSNLNSCGFLCLSFLFFLHLFSYQKLIKLCLCTLSMFLSVILMYTKDRPIEWILGNI